MKQGKALIISVVATLLVSVGVIAFNSSYSGDTAEPVVTVPADVDTDADRTSRLTLTVGEDEGSWRDDESVSESWDDDDEENEHDEREEDDDDEREDDD